MTTKHIEQPLPLPPGSFGLPVIGETIDYVRDPYFFKKRYKEYGSIFKTHLFGQPTVVMIGAEANQFLLIKENEYVSTNWPYGTKILLGSTSLAVQTGSKHQKLRKLLSEAFQPRALEGYVSTMESITRRYLHQWERMGRLTWYPELRKYTFDVACQLLVGTDVTNDSNFCKLFEGWFRGAFHFPIPLPWTKFGRALRCREQLMQRLEQIVLKRQQQPDLGQDVLGLLLQARDEDGRGLSLQEIKDHLLFLLSAGHETLSSANTSLCMFLAQHPEVLAAVRAEQEQLPLEEPLTLAHLKQMSYLEQVFKEVLRLIPPAGGGFRKVIKSCEFNGYLIPQGWSAFYEISNTHQDSSIYTQPERFDPQRFAAERAEDKTKPFGYVAFGGGVRECLGKEFAKLEMKIFVALLAREYEWELLPGQNLDIVLNPSPQPGDGLLVKLRRRVLQ